MSSLGYIMQKYVDQQGLHSLEGVCKTAIPHVCFFRSSQGNPRQPFTYQSGVLVLGQGNKDIHIGDSRVSYGPNDYLVVGVPLPLECEAFAQKDKPILGVSISIDQSTLQRMVNTLVQDNSDLPMETKKDSTCLDSVPMDDMMLNTCLRLMTALCDGTEAKILGPLIYEELIYRVLTSEKGHVLFSLAGMESQYARIAKALNIVHENYHGLLTVQELANEANMSISAFHQAFRSVTLESPLQYIKKSAPQQSKRTDTT